MVTPRISRQGRPGQVRERHQGLRQGCRRRRRCQFRGRGRASWSPCSGPSGCGKTTTLRMIAGLEMATSGRILIGDKDVTILPATDRDVSMVFQSYALFPHMTVLENVCYGLGFSGFPKAGGPGPGASRARARRAQGLRRPAAQRALGRPAAARRRGPRAGARAAGAAVRRTAVEPRRQAAPPGARGHPRDPAGPRA